MPLNHNEFIRALTVPRHNPKQINNHILSSLLQEGLMSNHTKFTSRAYTKYEMMGQDLSFSVFVVTLTRKASKTMIVGAINDHFTSHSDILSIMSLLNKVLWSAAIFSVLTLPLLKILLPLCCLCPLCDTNGSSS